MPSINVNQLEIFYFDNEIDGIPLVFIHGWLGSLDEWIYQSNYFNSKIHVITIDLPGFGKSDKPKRIYSIEFFTKQVLDLLKILGYNEVNLIGHSLGGMIAQNIAIQNPNLVKKLILISTSAKFSQPIKEKFKIFFVYIIFKLFYKTFLKKTVQRIISVKEYNEEVEVHYNNALKIPKSVVLRTFKNMTIKTNLNKNLSKIHQPTLIIYGSEDNIISKSMINNLDNLIPNSEIKLIENSPHRVMVDNHEEVNKLINEFINN